ncbi:ESPR-type extended signal peptide-containing protein [Turicimonas muris]|uniref:ESPR-type extended signal peptide-containing protein n=1 Tax=Turicimonas muris TaxID=1796652 RepID=UPI00333B288E
MNKAFKVLWNDARRTFVVSSETKMSRGKSTKASKKMLVISLAGILACKLGGGVNYLRLT